MWLDVGLRKARGLVLRCDAMVVAGRIDGKLALSLERDNPGFDNSVLAEFRARLVRQALDVLVHTTPTAQSPWPDYKPQPDQGQRKLASNDKTSNTKGPSISTLRHFHTRRIDVRPEFGPRLASGSS